MQLSVPLPLRKHSKSFPASLASIVLSFSRDSVLLSFISFPPLEKEKNLSHLAVTIQERNYHAIVVNTSFVNTYLRNTQKEHLKIIADDILRNNKQFTSLLGNFMLTDKMINIAFIMERYSLGLFTEKFFT